MEVKKKFLQRYQWWLQDKGIVEEKDLRIPNMRGIMMARKKPLSVVEPTGAAAATSTQNFEKPAPKEQ